MPRHATLTVYERADSPVFWARTTLPGGRRWFSPTSEPRTGDRGRAYEEAAKLYLQALEGHRRDGAALPGEVLERLSLSALVVKFLAAERKRYTGHDDRHHGRYSTDLNCYVLTRWSRIDEITSAAWEKAREELHKDHGGPLGSRSIAHLANTVRHFLRWAREFGAIATVPEIESPSTKKQRAEQRKRAAFEPRERERFLRALRDLGEPRAVAIYTVLFFSLLRKGELAALTPRWIDWRKKVIHLPAEHTKSKEPEEAPLLPRAERVLRAWVSGEPEDIDKPVFGPFDFHQANTADLQGGIFGRALLKAKLVTLKPDGRLDFRGLTPHHVTRHTSATIAADAEGTTLAELMALGRWRSAEMPSRYLHPTVEAARRAGKRL